MSKTVRGLLFAAFAAASACLPLANDAAASDDPAPPLDRKGIDACVAATRPDLNDADLAEFAARVQKLDNRIEGLDWSGRNFSGKNLAGKMLVKMNLKGAILRGSDLTDAIICEGDLTNADLTGAHLDRAFIADGTELNGANLAKASARAANFADASGIIRIDGADLRGASTLCDDLPKCLGNGVQFSSVAGADLRGATIGTPCCTQPDLSGAKLDGLITHLGLSLDEHDHVRLAQLGAGVGEAGRITLLPDYGFSGKQAEFTGQELRQLAMLLPQMQAASIHPSFDCRHASTEVEKAVCTNPKLAALDAALDWLWKRVEHSPQEIAAQKKWAGTRSTCPSKDDLDQSLSFAGRKGIDCIGINYAQRIRVLAPKASLSVVDSGRYTTDAPLELPTGPTSALAHKFLIARGYRVDEIDVENLGKSAGKISGFGLWGNGHECGFEASEAETKRTGSKFQIFDTPEPAKRDEHFSIAFVATPQVIIRAGGENQFQCGARGGWSEVYFRQPADLIADFPAQ